MNLRDVPVLRVRDLHVIRDKVILAGIHWTIERGENWALIGPNGSGKTSLLKVCCGYLPETRGTVEDCDEISGQAGARPMRERIGLVSHTLQSRIEASQTIAEVIASGRRGMLNHWETIPCEEEPTIRKVLRQVRLLSAADQMWGQLSQGERQRALLGRALIGGKNLLFLDEPCAGLDPVARHQFLEHLDAFCRRPKSPPVVLVTHHVEEIVPAITHVLLLKSGKILAAGPKRSVLTSPCLSEAFGASARVRRTAGDHYRLTIDQSTRRRWL